MKHLCVIFAFLLVVTSFSASYAEEPAPPNIVYILADDAGYADFGCYGGESIPTPNIDRMAAEGMRFTQHYAGDTVCAPSRCVLLTGLHTGHCRIRGNSPGVMRPEDVTVAELLQDAGYRTGCSGKWGVGAPLPLDDPAHNGFDHFYGYISMWHAHNFYPEFLIRDGQKDPLRNVVDERWQGGDGRGIATTKLDYAPFLIVDDAIEFIEESSDQPFFLYLALNTPHANNEAGGAKTPERGMEVPDFGPFADEEWPGPEKGFAAMIHNIDLWVGRVLDTLKEQGIDDNTLVIFTSDNGPHQEGGHQMEYFNSNGELRGMKRDFYQGGVRVPMIAHWPGRIAPGESDHICAFQDVLPTLTELAGAETPDGLDGISMLPTLLSNNDAQTEHDYLYWEFSEQGGKQAVRQGPWMCVRLNVSRETPSSPELYDLRVDLSETNDVAEDHPKIVQRMLGYMEASHVPSDAYPLHFSEKN